MLLFYLSWILPLRGLGDVVHEVDLAGGGGRLLPARGEGANILSSSHIIGVLSQVVVLLVESVVLK